MAIHPLNLTYRGFQLGYEIGLYGYKAAWRSSLEPRWKISFVYADSVSDCSELARNCLDWKYKQEAEEVSLGRKLTMNEVMRLGRREPGG